MQGKTKLRRWGNSFGVVVPKETVDKEDLRVGDEIEITLHKAFDIKKLFGKYRFPDLQSQKEKMRKGWD